MANEKGVWRTIGGRRVFIKEGQDLASAMKESGKFKSAKKFSKREELKKDIAHQVTEAEKNGNTAHAQIGKRELERLNNEEKEQAVKDYENGKISAEDVLNKFYGQEDKMKETFEQMGYTAPTKENIDKANTRHEEFMKDLKNKEDSKTSNKELASNSGQEKINDNLKVMNYNGTYIVTDKGANIGEFKTQAEAEKFAQSKEGNPIEDFINKEGINAGGRLREVDREAEEFFNQIKNANRTDEEAKTLLHFKYPNSNEDNLLDRYKQWEKDKSRSFGNDFLRQAKNLNDYESGKISQEEYNKTLGANVVGRYKDEDREYRIEKYNNGKYYNQYTGNVVAGPFESQKEAEDMMKKHRPNATKTTNETTNNNIRKTSGRQEIKNASPSQIEKGDLIGPKHLLVTAIRPASVEKDGYSSGYSVTTKDSNGNTSRQIISDSARNTIYKKQPTNQSMNDTLRNAFNDYRKKHKNSNMSFTEFMRINKK